MSRKSKIKGQLLSNESNAPPILEIGFSDPLFSAAAHPTRPIIVSGLGTGHVFCHTYNPDALEDNLVNERNSFLSKEKTSNAQISSLKKKWWVSEVDHANLVSDKSVSISWKTKRHKGSCRSVIFDTKENDTGENVFTAGTDNMLKKAKTETGKVVSKSDVTSSLEGTSKDSITTLSMSLTHPFLVSGTENGNLFVHDSNNLSAGKLKFRLDNVHEDAINKILPMPAVSAYHFLALGSTRLAHVDVRKGIVTQSDDQEDELLSMCYPSEFVNGHGNDTVVVTHGEGIITLWRNSANGFSDQLSRVKLNKNASIDAIIPTMNADDTLVDSVWCGDSEGHVYLVDYKKGKILETRVHSSMMTKSGAVDEVGGLDIDCDYRLVSSGMEGLKIWSNQPFDELENSESGCESEEDMGEDQSEPDSDASLSNFDQEDDEGILSSDSQASFGYSGDAFENEYEVIDDLRGSENANSITRTKKRADMFHILQKSKREKIDINRVKKKEEGSGENASIVKRKDKPVKKGTFTNSITKFEGL